MFLTDLQKAVRELDEAFGRRDLEAVLSFYEDEATVVVEPGRLAQGKEQLQKFFSYLFTLNGSAEQLRTNVIESGDIALFTSRWRFSGTAPNGTSLESERTATCVFRRALDGRWRMIIDNSYGPAVLDAADA